MLWTLSGLARYAGVAAMTDLAADVQALSVEVQGMTFAALKWSPVDPDWRAAGSVPARISGYALDLA